MTKKKWSPPKRKVLYLSVTDEGRRVGEDHHNSTISDLVVDQVREMYEDQNMTMKQIHEKTNIAYSTVSKIVKYERRAITATRVKRVTVYE